MEIGVGINMFLSEIYYKPIYCITPTFINAFQDPIAQT